MRATVRPTATQRLFIVALGVLLPACAGTLSAPANPSPNPSSTPLPIYASWEVATLAELDTLLTVKGCEGWRVQQIFPRDEKIVAVIVRDGPAPAPDGSCR